MLRQAGIAKGIATVPLCFIKKKKHKIIEKIFINSYLFIKFKNIFFATFINNSGFSIYFIFFEKIISPFSFSICIFLLFLFSKTVIFPISF